MAITKIFVTAHFFVRSGYEYYANARFAMHAQSSYVCGNLFHHAVEMLLKADLAKSGASLEELQRMGHNLKRLWRAYKTNHPNAAPSRIHSLKRAADSSTDHGGGKRRGSIAVCTACNRAAHKTGIELEAADVTLSFLHFGDSPPPHTQMWRVSFWE
jgi:hypothetical protein